MKMKFPSAMTDKELLEALASELSIDNSRTRMSFIDCNNKPIVFENVKCYYTAQQAKYAGATKLYLALQPVWLRDGDENLTLLDVQEFLLAAAASMETMPSPDDVIGDGAAGNVAVSDCSEVRLFLVSQNLAHEVLHTAWGDFFSLSKDEISRFNSSEIAHLNCFIGNIPFRYYLYSVLNISSDDKVKAMGNDVFQLEPIAARGFASWLKTMENL